MSDDDLIAAMERADKLMPDPCFGEVLRRFKTLRSEHKKLKAEEWRWNAFLRKLPNEYADRWPTFLTNEIKLKAR